MWRRAIRGSRRWRSWCRSAWADIAALVQFAQENAIDLVFPGPEGPLVAGITDAMAAAGIACCGPTAAAAQLEGSKAFTKEVADAAGIPTTRWERFTDAAEARDFASRRGAPIVVKADGLAGPARASWWRRPRRRRTPPSTASSRTGPVVIEECLSRAGGQPVRPVRRHGCRVPRHRARPQARGRRRHRAQHRRHGRHLPRAGFRPGAGDGPDHPPRPGGDGAPRHAVPRRALSPG